MRIDILYVEGCPNHAPTVERVKQIAAEMGLTVPVREVPIATPEEAEQGRFLGVTHRLRQWRPVRTGQDAGEARG